LKNVEHIVGELQFQMLYPPEGSSSILEVADNGIGPFLYVSLKKDGGLIYEFFTKPSIAITDKQFREINAKARKRLSWTDLSAWGLERFDEN